MRMMKAALQLLQSHASCKNEWGGKRGCWASLRCCGQICRCSDGEKKSKKKKGGTRTWSRESQEDQSASNQLHARSIYKQTTCENISCAHIDDTAKVTLNSFSFSSSKTGSIVVSLCKQTQAHSLFFSHQVIRAYTNVHTRQCNSSLIHFFFSPSAELITKKKNAILNRWLSYIFFFFGWSLLLRCCIRESNMEL